MSGQRIVALNASVMIHARSACPDQEQQFNFGAGTSYLLVYPEDGEYNAGAYSPLARLEPAAFGK